MNKQMFAALAVFLMGVPRLGAAADFALRDGDTAVPLPLRDCPLPEEPKR